MNESHASRKQRCSNVIGSVHAVAIVLTCVILVLFIPSLSDALIGLKEGESPEKFKLSDLSGNEVTLEQHMGTKPVIIVFWELAMSTSFLDYSLDELKYLNAVYEKYGKDPGVEILAIYTPEEEGVLPEGELEKVKNLVKVHNLRFPVLIDKGFKTFRQYGVIALPTTVMVGRDSSIQFIYPSFPMAAQPLFDSAVLQLVGLAPSDDKREAETQKKKDSHAVRLYNYALQMYKKGLYEQAISPLRKSIETDSGQDHSHNLMGVLLWQKGSFEEAQEEFLAAMKLDMQNLYPHYNYGVVLFKSGRYKEAETYLNKALSIDADNAESHYVLGLVYKNTDKLEAAMKELEEAMRLFEAKAAGPAHQVSAMSSYRRISVLYELSELYKVKGQSARCVEMLQKAAQIALGFNGTSVTARNRHDGNLMLYE